MATLILDTHLHLYDEFCGRRFLLSSIANLRGIARGAGIEAGHLGCCLAEIGKSDYRARLAETARSLGFAVRELGGQALSLSRASDSLLVFPARQYVSRERLELMALFDRDIDLGDFAFEDGAREIAKRGALAAIPWSFLKWTGRRRRVLEAAMQALVGTERVVFADNGGRVRFSPLPGILRRARDLGFPVLTGSDPLPLTKEAGRAGTSAVVVDVELAGEAPSPARLVDALSDPRGGYRSVTGRVPPLRFASNQLRIQLRAHARKRVRSAGNGG